MFTSWYRWWHLAVVGVTTIMVTIFLLSEPETTPLVAGLAGCALYVAAWFGFGWRGLTSPRAGVVFTVFAIVLTGALASIHPSFATMQCITFPLVWSVAANLRGAIIANIGVALSVGIGLAAGDGFSEGGIAEAAVIGGLSLIFSLAMGLWITRIWRLSDERQALFEQLQATQATLAAAHRDAGVTSERERLAREIHDTIAQDLTGLILIGQQAQRSLRAGQVNAAAEQLTLLEENARLALSETRALVAATSPAALDEGGIGPALERLALRFTRETGVEVSVTVDAAAPLDRATEVVLLRCAQEGLANIRKHAFARTAHLGLSASPHGTSLTIDDDGTGFDPALADGAGFGITGMRDRLALVDGGLDISSSAAGTRLIISLPAGVPS